MNKALRFLAFGQLSFVLGFLGFLINYFYLNHNSILAFVTGLLFGLSLILNLTYLAKHRARSDN